MQTQSFRIGKIVGWNQIRYRLSLLAILMNFGLALTPGNAADWPQFLGPDRNGISAETGLIDKWPTEGPKEVWRVPGGVGMSGLAISRDRLITLVQKKGRQLMVARNALTGELVWERELADEYRNGMGDGPRGTPAISQNLVIAFTGNGILTAVNFVDGKTIWSHNVVEELKGKVADYGMACSPLIVGDRVFVTVGAPHATVASYETATGTLAWTSGDDPAGYSSPAMVPLGGQLQLVVFSGSSVLGLKPVNGSVLWRHRYETNFDCNIATPIGVKGKIFVSSGENQGSAMLDIKKQGDHFEVAESWKSQGVKSVMRNEWQTSILLDGFLYGFDNVGAAGAVSHLTCIDAGTGERAWQKARFGKGNLIAADGKLFVSTINGELVVVRATPKAFEEIGRSSVVDSTRQAPALANGLRYLRDNAEIACFEVRKR